MKNTYILISSLILLSAVACKKDSDGRIEIKSDDGISFILSEKETLESKAGGSASSSFMLMSESGQDTLWITRRVSPTSRGTGFIADTKGVPVTTDNLVSQYNGNVGIAAYKKTDSGYESYIPVSSLKNDSGSLWNIMDGETKKTYLWPSSDIQFWAWAPKNNISPTFNGMTASFEYSMPAPGGEGKDAEGMPDVLFTGTLANANTDNGKAPLHLEHALAALKFEIGKTNDCTIKSISLKNLYSKATCTYTFGISESIVWSNLSTKYTYAQSFGDKVEEYLIDDDNTQPIGTPAKTFMVIPQTSDKDNTIVLEVVYSLSDASEDVTVFKELDADSSGWKAGYTYTYTLSIINGLDIEIDDTVTDNVKSNLQISNVGGKPAYVRVLVTGAWVNADGDIVANWDPTDANVGTFSPAIFGGASYSTDHWTRGADGFFYYKHVLLPGESIPAAKQLFDTYTAKESGMPKILKLGDHLEIDVVSQAVVVDAGKAAITTVWGSEAAGYVTE